MSWLREGEWWCSYLHRVCVELRLMLLFERVLLVHSAGAGSRDEVVGTFIIYNVPSKMIGSSTKPFFSMIVDDFDGQGDMLRFRCSMSMTEIQELAFDKKIG